MSKWIRDIRAIVDGRTFEYQGYEIHFQVKFDDTEDPDQATVKIYNLTPELEESIEVGGDFFLEAGFVGDIGVLLEGVITDVHAEQDGTERICEVEAADSAEECLNKQVTKTFAPGTPASWVIDTVVGMSGLTLKENRLFEDVIYDRGYHIDGKVREILKDVTVNDCRSKLQVVHKDVSAIPWQDAIEDPGITLTQKTGLIGTPTRISGDHTARTYEIKCLLEHRLRAGMVVNVYSQTANGSYLIKKGEHRSDRPDHITVFEAIDWSGNMAGGAPFVGGGAKERDSEGGFVSPGEEVVPLPEIPTWDDLF